MKLTRNKLRKLIFESILLWEDSDSEHVDIPTPDNTSNDVGKQKVWTQIKHFKKQKQHKYLLGKFSYGGGSGLWLVSEKSFSIVDDKGNRYEAEKRDRLSYWKGKLPVYVIIAKLDGYQIGCTRNEEDDYGIGNKIEKIIADPGQVIKATVYSR